MFLEKPEEKDSKSLKQKKITLRIPGKLWNSIQEKAKEEYTGKGKQSQLVNEALEHFFRVSAIDDINWNNPSDDYVLINLLTQIKLGANMKNIGSNPVQANVNIELMEKLITLELNIKNSRKMLDVHIKPAIIRMALSQWMFADRKLIKRMADN
ncbi:MAG: hypothetical protein QM652_05125 [Legionella sp.]|uniref:hypothetical protein n=1 Tax=Legionella sp. TaxID=459 RepID=UPI0039E548DC